jgi:hypothetical protein
MVMWLATHDEMYTVVSARMEIATTILFESDMILNEYLSFRLGDIFETILADIRTSNKLASIWNGGASNSYNDLTIFLRLMQRHIYKQNVPGLIWCMNEVFRTINKNSYGTLTVSPFKVTAKRVAV